MAAIGHLGIRFSWLCDHRRVPSAELMLNSNTKSGSNRTNRFEVIQFLVNFSFFVGGHLGFWKVTVLSLTLYVCHQGEAPYQIWWESVQRFWSYSSFRKFINCGAAILDSVILKCLPIFSFCVTCSMLERILVHVAWTVQKLWCFVTFSISLYFNMGFYCACANCS